MVRHVQYPRFPRHLLRRLEDTAFPLVSLQAVREARAYLDEVERQSILKAREMGASAGDIAVQLGITRQGAHLKLKRLGASHIPQ